jgi:hypothetical protein
MRRFALMMTLTGSLAAFAAAPANAGQPQYEPAYFNGTAVTINAIEVPQNGASEANGSWAQHRAAAAPTTPPRTARATGGWGEHGITHGARPYTVILRARATSAESDSTATTAKVIVALAALALPAFSAWRVSRSHVRPWGRLAR